MGSDDDEFGYSDEDFYEPESYEFEPEFDEPSGEELDRLEEARLDAQIEEACSADPSGPIC